MAADRSWANAMRAEALATLFLTRRSDLEVIPVASHSRRAGYDLLVRRHQEGKQGPSEFAVEAKGVRTRTMERAGRTRVQIDPDRLTSVDLPLVLFVFDVDNETGFYQWLNEPFVTKDGQAVLPAFGRSSSPTNGHPPVPVRLADLRPLDDSALDKILGLVAEWSSARDNLLAPVG